VEVVLPTPPLPEVTTSTLPCLTFSLAFFCFDFGFFIAGASPKDRDGPGTHTSTDSTQSRELSQKRSDDSDDGWVARKQAHSTPAMVTRRLTALRKHGQLPNGSCQRAVTILQQPCSHSSGSANSPSQPQAREGLSAMFRCVSTGLAFSAEAVVGFLAIDEVAFAAALRAPFLLSWSKST